MSRDPVMAGACYGGEARAISRGMGMIHASEKSDDGISPPRGRLIAAAAPHQTYATFEVLRDVCAGPDEERPPCASLDPDLFFPKAGAAVSELNAIRRICGRCPRREICRQVGEHEPAGIWGGTTTNERKVARALRKKKRGAA